MPRVLSLGRVHPVRVVFLRPVRVAPLLISPNNLS